MEAAELEVAADRNWLVGCYPDGKGHVSIGTTRRRIHPIEVPRVCRQDRYVGYDSARSRGW